MKTIETKFIEKEIKYDGTQLSPLWIYKNFDLKGDAIVSFLGPAELDARTMVDMEDVKANDRIYSESMVHFIAEFFDLDLEKTVFRQRLLMVTMKEVLEAKLNRVFTRNGDDIMDGNAKLTVSIATSSAVSTLIHSGINIVNRNTPVLTKGLEDYGVHPPQFAKDVLQSFKSELDSSWAARCKVRPV